MPNLAVYISELTSTLTYISRFPFPKNVTEELYQMSDDCGFEKLMEEALQFPPKDHFYLDPPRGIAAQFNETERCLTFSAVMSVIIPINPCFNVYQVSSTCPLQWDSLGFPATTNYLPPGYPEPYFNQTKVKEVLHASLDTDWKLCTDARMYFFRLSLYTMFFTFG